MLAMSKPTSPLTTVTIYAICAVIWALSVDLLITLLRGHVDPKLLTWLLHYKGIIFALLSSVLLLILLRSYRNKLNVSEKAYIRMFRENPQPMWIYRKADFRFLEVNDAAVGLYGYTREEFLQMTILDIRPKEDITRVRENRKAHTSPGYSPSGIWRHCKKDGSLMYVRVESFVITYNNEAAEVISIFDVTAVHLAGEEIRRLSLVASMTHNPVLITDRHACIEWVNKSFEDLTGYALEEIKGLQPHAFLHGEGTNPEIVREIGEKMATGQPCVVEVLNYTSTGEPYWVVMDITPIADATGEIERHIVIQTNITERKKFQQQLEEKNRLLLDVGFISSHRLRMPVASLLGLFAQLDKENLANPDNLPLLLHIEKLVKSMDDMLHEMADKCNQIYNKDKGDNGQSFNNL